MRQQLVGLNDLIRTVFVKTSKRYFKEMLNTLNQTFIDGKSNNRMLKTIAILRYVMVLSSLGPQLNVCCDYFFQSPNILQNDIKEIIGKFKRLNV